MTSFPTPERTPEGLRYEGRLLHHPDEEVVDQGLRFDLDTLIDRRRLLGVFGVGVATLGLAACGALGGTGGSSTSSTGSATADSGPAEGEIPEETAGPYPGDGSNGPNVLENSGIVRSDIRSSIGGGATATGVPMTLTLTILDAANDDAPFTGTAVYVWHCDADGAYSMYSTGLENETYLRGVQVADDAGEVTFTSIFPGCYTGRWPHIHFEVYPDQASITDVTNAIATSQVAIPENDAQTVYARADYPGSASNLSAITLASDNVFGDDGGELQLATVTGDADSGYTVALTVRVDTRTEAGTGGAAPSGGAGAPGGGPGGPGGDADTPPEPPQ